MIAKQPVRMIAKAHVNTIVMIPVQVALVVEDVQIAHPHVPVTVLLPVVIHVKKDVQIPAKVLLLANLQQVR